MAGDEYDRAAAQLGIPPNLITNWRKAAGAPAPVVAPPPPPAPSFLVPQEYRPAGPAAVAPPVAPTIEATKPKGMPLATGSNVDVAPASVNPKVQRQIEQVARNSAAMQEDVKANVGAENRKKNLEGATFADSAPSGDEIQGGGRPAAPVLVDPGGRRPASWQVQQGLDLGPQAAEAVGSADERARTAAALDYNAGQKAAEFERGYLDRYSQAAGKYAAEESARAQKYIEQTDAHMQSLDDLRAQIREAKTNSGDNSAVARLGQAVAMAMGAFASKHGENHGLDAVRHAIAMNQKESQDKLDKLARGVGAETTFLGALKQQYGDIRVAKEAERIAQLEQSKVELAKQLGSPEVADPRLLAAYERLQGKLDEELINRTAHFKGMTEDRVVRHDINAQARYAGGTTAEAKHDARYLSEAYEKAGLPASLSELKDVDRVIDSFGDGDVPGIGPVAGKVPAMFISDRGVAARQAVQSIKNSIGHLRFGGALSPTEAEKLDAQLEGAKDAASLRRTVQALRQTIQHRAANIAAGASPEGQDLYEGRGGSVQRGPVSQRQVSLTKGTTPTIQEAK